MKKKIFSKFALFRWEKKRKDRLERKQKGERDSTTQEQQWHHQSSSSRDPWLRRRRKRCRCCWFVVARLPRPRDVRFPSLLCRRSVQMSVFQKSAFGSERKAYLLSLALLVLLPLLELGLDLFHDGGDVGLRGGGLNVNFGELLDDAEGEVELCG